MFVAAFVKEGTICEGRQYIQRWPHGGVRDDALALKAAVHAI